MADRTPDGPEFATILFVYTIEARMRANTQNVRQGEQEMRGEQKGKQEKEQSEIANPRQDFF